jgi:hypothetical protein
LGWVGRGREGGRLRGTDLADWLLVCYAVCRCGGCVARVECVAYERGAERLDHELVVVEGGDDDFGGDAVEGGGDVRGRHFEGIGVFAGLVWLREKVGRAGVVA